MWHLSVLHHLAQSYTSIILDPKCHSLNLDHCFKLKISLCKLIAAMWSSKSYKSNTKVVNTQCIMTFLFDKRNLLSLPTHTARGQNI